MILGRDRISGLNQYAQHKETRWKSLLLLWQSMRAVLDLKKKAGELKDAAVKLHYAMSDPCNSEQMAALKEHIVDDPNTPKRRHGFESIVSRLISKTKGLVKEEIKKVLLKSR